MENNLNIIINDDPEDRKIIHQYLEGKTNKFSTYINLFDSIPKIFILDCSLCGLKNKLTMNDIYSYEDGYGTHNEDYLLKYCNKCDETITCFFERKYDENVKIIYSNNAIIYSDCLKNYNTPKYAVIKEILKEEFEEILKRSIKFTIPYDFKCISKKEIVKLIISKYNNN